MGALPKTCWRSWRLRFRCQPRLFSYMLFRALNRRTRWMEFQMSLLTYIDALSWYCWMSFRTFIEMQLANIVLWQPGQVMARLATVVYGHFGLIMALGKHIFRSFHINHFFLYNMGLENSCTKYGRKLVRIIVPNFQLRHLVWKYSIFFLQFIGNFSIFCPWYFCSLSLSVTLVPLVFRLHVLVRIVLSLHHSFSFNANSE